MRMKKFLAIAAVSTSLAGFGGNAWAADVIAPATYDWSGIYFGVHAGYGFGDVSFDTSLTGESVDADPEGFVGGAQAGYNYQTGNLVFGPEVSFSFADIDGGDFDSAVPGITFGGSIEWFAVAGGRLGFAADRVLIYLHGGYAIGEVGTEGNNPGLGDAFSDSETHDGYAVGVGAEYAATDNVLVGLKYTFVDLGSEDHSGTTNLAIPYTNSDVDAEIHAVAATLNVKF